MSTITLDGSLQDWTAADLLPTAFPANGYSVYGKFDSSTSTYFLALKLDNAAGAAETSIGANTTIWLNTDRNAGTGYQVFGSSVGAEYKIEFGANGIPTLYSLDAAGGITAASAGLQYKFSPDNQTIELSIPQSVLSQNFASGAIPGVDLALDINDRVFTPSNFGAPFTIKAPAAHLDDHQLKVGIVYSETSAARYFNSTAYSDLFMAAQNQATMAGIPYDVLSEADLKNIDTLKQYDTLIFPSFANVKNGDLSAIQNTLTDAVYKYGISLIAAGNFMTNDENGNALTGDAYARMKSLLGVQPDHFDSVTSDAIHASGDNAASVIGYAADPDNPIHTYTANATSNVGVAVYTGTDPSAQVVATQTTTGGQQPGTHNAILATQTGGKNVFFSTEGMLADSNMLSHALDYTIQSQKPAGPELSLQMSRFASIVATRVDMDQAMYPEDVAPGGGPGINDKFLSIVQQWKQSYNFAGSYYVDIGDGQNGTYASNTSGSDTSLWTSASLAKSASFYQQLIALGGEIGSHTMTHPEDTNPLTAAQLAYQFGTSKTLLEKYLPGYQVVGTALPGAPETLATDENIYNAAPSYAYITGRYTGVGANYPGAFGYLTPSASDTQKVFLAPNMKADFSLVEALPQFGGGMTADQAAAEWKKEFDTLSSHSDLPVAVWTWHDYGAAQWPTDGSGQSPYTTDMYTSFISYASQKGSEFVTLADLAQRITASEKATFDYRFDSGTNTLTASVTGGNLGNFALDLQAGYHIASVSNGGQAWYAYDDDSVFLPASLSGATYSIQLGTSASRVTHITALPMRADLVSLSGNGRDLSFQVTGDGQVSLDLADLNGQTVEVAGATVVSQTQDATGSHLVLSLTGLTTHDVSVKLVPTPTTDTVPPSVIVSADASSLKAGQTALITFTFSEAVTGFDANDVSVTGGTLGAISQTDGTHYIATFTPVVSDNLSASIQVAASGTGTSSWFDASANPGPASNVLTITGDTNGVGDPQPQNKSFFGEVSNDPHSAAGEVYALYDAVLHRPSDVGGQQYWTGLHSAGLSLHDLAQAFLDSSEGQSHLGSGDNLSFVQALYQTALDRVGDTGGVQYWTSALDQGLSRADAIVSFAFSTENLAGLQSAYGAGIFTADADAGEAARLYYGLLNRAPDAGGLQYWTGALKGGLSDADAAQSFIGSTEHQVKYASLTDAAFVDTLYQNALGRQADTGGHDYWAGILAQGGSRASVAVGITQSDEAHQHLLSFIETGWHLV
ncbi:DUF4214 domain-containing protein [Methylobacterium durans]|uniref:DUF4214 domain-containing protein n=1 Tax=Methylobacterium durans TaxID=2202825 RepID=UPI002AFE6FCB|nr:DUF4214 domain-containing protein [Methylobacterium durans]MEA1832368.1 DUF4214 domain-containing protein [Methylobacterium durans]